MSKEARREVAFYYRRNGGLKKVVEKTPSYEALKDCSISELPAKGIFIFYDTEENLPDKMSLEQARKANLVKDLTYDQEKALFGQIKKRLLTQSEAEKEFRRTESILGGNLFEALRHMSVGRTFIQGPKHDPGFKPRSRQESRVE
jgi:hypothetical protein